MLTGNDLIEGHYYVVYGRPDPELLFEEIMVKFISRKDYVERDDGKDGGETIYRFEMVKELKGDSEYVPEPGQIERIKEEDYAEMAQKNIHIRDATSTELVLYGRSK